MPLLKTLWVFRENLFSIKLEPQNTTAWIIRKFQAIIEVEQSWSSSLEFSTSCTLAWENMAPIWCQKFKIISDSSIGLACLSSENLDHFNQVKASNWLKYLKHGL